MGPSLSLRLVFIAIALVLVISKASAIVIRQKGCKKVTPTIGTVTPAPGQTSTTSLPSNSEPGDRDVGDEQEASCFPGDATVLLDSGVIRKMADLSIGDRVYTGNGLYSDVFMFTHKLSESQHRFLHIGTASGSKLKVTPGHYLYVNGNLAPAKAIALGDMLELADGSSEPVTQVSEVEASGLYNPQTLNGDIFVDGVKASTYTTAVAPAIAHAALSPLRALYKKTGFSASVERNFPASLLSMLPKPSEAF